MQDSDHLRAIPNLRAIPQMNAGPALAVINGGAGVGKSTFLANVITAFLLHQPTARILIVAASNQACDVLFQKTSNCIEMAKMDERYTQILTPVKTVRVEKTVNVIAANNVITANNVIATANVIAIIINTLGIKSNRDNLGAVDLCIFEEFDTANIAQNLWFLHRLTFLSRFVLVIEPNLDHIQIRFMDLADALESCDNLA